jgi:hypothetical protein
VAPPGLSELEALFLDVSLKLAKMSVVRKRGLFHVERAFLGSTWNVGI